jgi:predicted HAD superfamily Cof-like phosphohydrolase
VEAAAQLAVYLYNSRLTEPLLAAFTRIENCSFRNVVQPGDKLYILCGTILAHGMQHKIVEIFEEIHRSNMSKLDENGKPIYREDGKILKSSNYFVPDINKVLSTEQEVG